MKILSLLVIACHCLFIIVASCTYTHPSYWTNVEGVCTFWKLQKDTRIPKC